MAATRSRRQGQYRHNCKNAEHQIKCHGATLFDSPESIHKAPMPKRNQEPGYEDVFSDSEIRREPRVMKDGTSVRWPAGWTLEQAAWWRRKHKLESPEARR